MNVMRAPQWLTLGLFSLAQASCAVAVEDVPPASDEAASEELGETVQELRGNDRGHTGDRTVTMYHLRYKTSFFGSYRDLDDASLGKGATELKRIPDEESDNIYLSFPNGHIDNPTNVVLLSAGQQDGDGHEDTVTGQAADYKFRSSNAQRSVLGNSLLGRLDAHPLFPANDTYVILVHDNGANWGDGDSWKIHERFSQFVARKVGSRTQRVVLGGYSRGGIMVAEMARYLRGAGDVQLPPGLPLYVGIFDGVAGGTHFGVDTDNDEQNPIHGSSSYVKELSNVDAQVAAGHRKNTTFFFNHVSAADVGGTAVHAFGARTFDIYANYWMEHWDRLAHGAYKNSEHSPRLYDPFLTWFEHLESTAKTGSHHHYFHVDTVASGAQREFHLDARGGSSVLFDANWDSNLATDLDIEVFGPDGLWVASGTSWSTAGEYVNFTAPATGTYRVRLYAYSGAAAPNVFYLVESDPLSTGQVLLPWERVNSSSGFRRRFDVKNSGAGAVNLLLTWADAAANLDVYVKDAAGNVLTQSVSDQSEEFVSVPAGGRQHLVVEVVSRNNVETVFELRGTAPIAP
jgi:hypothetical protein